MFCMDSLMTIRYESKHVAGVLYVKLSSNLQRLRYSTVIKMYSKVYGKTQSWFNLMQVPPDDTEE
jgi:hypothetical protein